MLTLGMGLTVTRTMAPTWLPLELGSGLKLWLRPEELVNPNRLLQTADFEDVAWGKTGAPTITSGQTDPDGGASAFLITATGVSSRVTQSAVGFQANSDDAGSVWVKRGPGHNGTSNARLRHSDGVVTTTQNFVPAATWERREITKTLDAGAAQSKFEIWADVTTGTEDILVWHPQLESGIAASPYRANAATAGGIIASWVDQGPNGNDYGQGTQASMPLVQANVLDGWAGARFDAVDDRLNITPPSSLTQPFSIYSVSMADASDNGPHFMYCYDGASQIYLADYFQGGRAYAGTLIGDLTQYTGGDPIVMRGIFNGASSSVYINGVEVVSGDAGANEPSARNSSIGASTTGGGNGLLGYLFEMVVVERAVTATEDENIMAYIANKYPTLGV